MSVISEVDKCYLCDLLGDFEEFQDIKKEFDAQHACWNKLKYAKNKQKSKDELKTDELNSKSDQQEKSILKISDLNIENNSKQADFTAKKNAIAAAKNVENKNPVDVQNISAPIHLAGTPLNGRWKCPSCPYETKQKSNVTKHIKTKHLGIKKYKCEECSELFQSQQVLDNHMRTHTGQKPFVCPQCDYRSAKKGNMTKHVKRVHGEN